MPMSRQFGLVQYLPGTDRARPEKPLEVPQVGHVDDSPQIAFDIGGHVGTEEREPLDIRPGVEFGQAAAKDDLFQGQIWTAHGDFAEGQRLEFERRPPGPPANPRHSSSTGTSASRSEYTAPTVPGSRRSEVSSGGTIPARTGFRQPPTAGDSGGGSRPGPGRPAPLRWADRGRRSDGRRKAAAPAGLADLRAPVRPRPGDACASRASISANCLSIHIDDKLYDVIVQFARSATHWLLPRCPVGCLSPVPPTLPGPPEVDRWGEAAGASDQRSWWGFAGGVGV